MDPVSLYSFLKLFAFLFAYAPFFFFFGRDIHGISTQKDKIIAAIMVILAVITSTIAISVNIYKLVGTKS